MPPQKFNKATSTTFQLVHRPQNDPKIHDASSSSMVFQELAPSQSHKIKNRTDLESELFDDTVSNANPSRVRDNEGEAAEHGVYYDDTEYDYMQHIRDLHSGSGNGESFFVEAKIGNKEKKGKQKMSLEEALRESTLQDEQSESAVSSKAESLFESDMLPSSDLKLSSYQDQLDIPDALAGFQPDLDPRLREVLEALDDEAYVDDEEEFFDKIAKDGQEVSQREFEETEFLDGEEDGWESDTTEKPSKEYIPDSSDPPMVSEGDIPMYDAEAPDHGDGDWMKEFSKFKQATKASVIKATKAGPPVDASSSLLSGATSLANGRRKKRKGAMTGSTGYSMTSSSLARTEGLTLLDARFDKIEEEYAEDEDSMDMDGDGTASMFSENSLASKTSNVSKASGRSNFSNMSSASQAPELTTAGFEGIMDEFLGGYSMSGKKRVKKGGYQSGLEQLDEVRRELGPARLRAQGAS